MAAETEQERRQRRHQRTLFDSVAQLYEASRLGYPSDIVEVATAGLGAGSAVLEVGCGTGQLTECLARFGFRLKPGSAMTSLSAQPCAACGPRAAAPAAPW